MGKGQLSRFSKRLCSVCCGAIWATVTLYATSINAEDFILYSYHKVPPFVTNNTTGLTYDLAQQLERMSQGKHRFTVRLVPRKRLNELMTKQKVIVPWVTPVWFKGQGSDSFAWSAPIMIDSSVYIWRSDNPHNYRKPNDLIGTRLGGIRGYKYKGVDDLVKKQQVVRTDTSSEWQVMQMVMSNRVDVAIIPEAGACNLIRKHKLYGKFKISQHHSFTRKLMITGNSDRHLLSYMNNLENDQAWETRLAGYGARITPLGKRDESNYCDETLTTSFLLND